MASLVLVVEDDPHLRFLTSTLLEQSGHRVRTAADGVEALGAMTGELPDLVLTDFKMPRMDGMELVRRIKADPRTRLLPVVMLTAMGDLETKVRALEAGADDLIAKPMQRLELEARLRNLLRMKAYTDELENAETVLCMLAEGVEAKDPYTGRHCQRLSAWSVLVGQALGMGTEDLKALHRAAILHDLGKVGIPDAILLKPGPLTPEEWGVMRRHPAIGERLCKPMKTMRLVCPVIRHHHERFDGKGYPDGLAGEAIPLTARALQVVDAYDALRTRRPYKPPLSKETAFGILRDETKGGKWDPRVLEVFLGAMGGSVPLEETYAEDFLAGGAQASAPGGRPSG